MNTFKVSKGYVENWFSFLIHSMRLGLPRLLSPLLRFIPLYLSNDYSVSQIFDADVMINIDWWLRYNVVANQLKRMQCQSVLDVGGEHNYISRFFGSEIFVATLNIHKEYLSDCRSNRIVADGCNLPFATNSFDVVVSVATLLQIPKDKMQNFLRELKRVGRTVIVLEATESPDGTFKAQTAGRKFSYRRRILGLDHSTLKHAQKSFFLINEIRKAYPNAEYMGHKNSDSWLQYTTVSRTPILNLLTGLLYLHLWSKKDKQPPFYEVMAIEK